MRDHGCRWLGLLLCGVLVAGCAGTRPKAPRKAFIAYTPEQRAEVRAVAEAPYIIQPGDELKITFAYLDNMNQGGVVVLSDGTITLREVDSIHVGGLTVAEADSVITAAYAKIYLHPDLSVIVTNAVGKQVFVLGEVKAPGLYPVQEHGLPVVNAIARAGGFTENAAKDGTVLVRATEDGYLCQEIDLSSFHTVDSSMLAALQLQNYDVIYVPRRRMGDFAYFSRSVLAGIANVTRIISDTRYIATGQRR